VINSEQYSCMPIHHMRATLASLNIWKE